MLALVGVHFGIVWPGSYKETTNRFDMIVNVNPLTHTCLMECLGFNWYARFLGATLTPTLLAAVLVLAARALDYRSARRRASRQSVSQAPLNETAERLRWASQMARPFAIHPRPSFHGLARARGCWRGGSSTARPSRR